MDVTHNLGQGMSTSCKIICNHLNFICSEQGKLYSKHLYIIFYVNTCQLVSRSIWFGELLQTSSKRYLLLYFGVPPLSLIHI